MVVVAPFDQQAAPPGTVTVTVRPVRPVRAALTAAAQAAEPQALVRPAPRSQVRIVIASREVTWAIEMLARSGKDRMVFEQRPEAVELVGPDVAVDPEDRVRIAHR